MARQGLVPSRIASHLWHAYGGVLAFKTHIHSERLLSADFIDAALACGFERQCMEHRGPRSRWSRLMRPCLRTSPI